MRRTPRKYRAAVADQGWPLIILGNPQKYGTGLIYELALRHLHRLGGQHPSEACPLCTAKRETEVAA